MQFQIVNTRQTWWDIRASAYFAPALKTLNSWKYPHSAASTFALLLLLLVHLLCCCYYIFCAAASTFSMLLAHLPSAAASIFALLLVYLHTAASTFALFCWHICSAAGTFCTFHTSGLWFTSFWINHCNLKTNEPKSLHWFGLICS